MKTWFTFFSLLFCSSFLIGQTASIDKGCAPLLVDFTAPGGTTTFFWDFKDGATSDLQNPSHNFVAPGVYTVEFSETSNGPVLGTVTITVYDIPSIQDLITDPAVACAPADVSFEAILDKDDDIQITQFTWVFGDGGTAITTTNTANHTYSFRGSYTVSLGLTTNQPGCNVTIPIPNAVTLSDAPAIAFTADTINACEPPLTVNFTNNTPDNPNYLYNWTFGNGTNSNLRDPAAVTYTENGRYQVTLTVIDIDGCSVSTTQQINVGPPIIAISSPDTVCTFSPFVIESTSENGIAVWDFGPNGTGTQIAGTNNYQVTFNQVGIQTVSLTLTSPDGLCTSDTTFSIFADQADATFTSVPTFSCDRTLTSLFTPNSTVGATYEWTFQGGDTSTQFSPTYTYENGDTTIYSINGEVLFDTRLRVTNASGCVATFRLTDTIHQPNALFTIDTIQGCFPLTVTFSDSSASLSPLTTWLWDFGDGATETRNDNNTVTHTYTAAGEYDARLIVTNEKGCMDTSYVIQILVGDAIVPDFAADQTDVCPGDTVRYSDLTNNPNIDAWHFETDRGRSFHCFQDPSLAWAFERETGIMDVSLTVEYNGCFSTTTKADFINVKGPIAQLDYEIDCANPFDVAFRDSSMDATSILWEFGDTLNRSTLSEPTFTFADTGIYVVKLIAENGTSGCQASIDSATIYIRDVKAAITLDTILCLGQEYDLDATLSEGVDADCYKGYTWFFPNVERPITTQDSIISHMFNRPDTQTVRLIVEDINGCKDTSDLTVRVFGIYPDLTADDTRICNPATVTFGNATTADTTIVSIEWEFGDPSMGTSMDSLPTYTFTEPPAMGGSSYIVNVNFEDAVGCPGSGTVNIGWYEPVSTITADPSGICIGDAINFTASDFTQEGSFLNFEWDFGNGDPISTQQMNTVTYDNQTGPVTVNLNFTEDASGCMGSTSTVINIQDYPIADFSADQDTNSQLCPGNVVFIDQSTSNFPPLTQQWDFGNGIPANNGDTVTTNYNVGDYRVQLIVSTSNGCSDTTFRDITVVGPTGDFEYSPFAICLGDSIEFVLKDTQQVVSWIWDLGEGVVIQNQDSVRHAYSFVPASGRQPVSLTLTGPRGCSNVVTGTVFIQNTFSDFLVGDGIDTVFCENESVDFQNFSLNSDNFNWNFGDGGTSTQEFPSYSYTTSGTYTVTLEVNENVLGCTNSSEKTVIIQPQPTAEIIGDETACLNTPTELSITDYDNAVNEYSWSPDVNVNNGASVQVILTNSNPVTYTLTVVDRANDCIAFDQITLTPIDAIDSLPSVVQFDVCPGETNPVPVTVTDPSYAYSWTGPGVGGLSCTDCPNPNYTAPDNAANTSFTLTIDQSSGCPAVSTDYFVTVGDSAFFEMPNSFTPDNGDNLNDEFNFVLMDPFQGNEDQVTVDRFQVFNRFGQMVYDNDTPVTGWDGMQDGKQAPSDTYVFVIELTYQGCLKQSKKGNFMLIR